MNRVLLPAGVVIFVTMLSGIASAQKTGRFLDVFERSFRDDAEMPLVAQTTHGQVLGEQLQSGILQFRSIPFAEPPLGQLRFAPPQAAKGWEGILDTTEYGPSCVQPSNRGEAASLAPQSEDCLYLTINTPALDDAKRPVIVWIHGGGYTQGGIRDPGYNGETFARRGDIVFVNLQYRLGALGWLKFETLDGVDGRATVANATLDQLAGLKWVQDNAAAFGGEPENITLMGESAGSGSIAALMRYEASAPFYSKAILQSGVSEILTDVVGPKEAAELFLDVNEFLDVEELMALSARKMRGAQIAFEKHLNGRGLPGSGPAFGPPSLTRDDLATMGERGKTILHGTTNQEMHFFLLGNPNADRAQLSRGLMSLVGIDEYEYNTLFGLLKAATPDRSDEDLALDLLTNLLMYSPHNLLAQEFGSRAPTYNFVFDYPLPAQPSLGAVHAMEIPYVFHNLEAWTWALDDPPNVALSEQMQDAWIAFARTGIPDHPNLPEWPVYDSETKPIMSFGSPTRLILDRTPWLDELVAKFEELSQ